MSKRACSRCHEEKPLTEFYVKSSYKLGRDYTCMSCRREIQKQRSAIKKTCDTCGVTKGIQYFYKDEDTCKKCLSYRSEVVKMKNKPSSKLKPIHEELKDPNSPLLHQNMWIKISLTPDSLSRGRHSKNNYAGKPVRIKGVDYKSTQEAAELLGHGYEHVRYRLRSKAYPAWKVL